LVYSQAQESRDETLATSIFLMFWDKKYSWSYLPSRK
jgi:hypothetical protein